MHDAIVIGAGQAGLAASAHLARRGIEHLVLDADDAPGGAWRHRWDDLTMRDVHGVADLPGERAPARSDERANQAVPAYFADYERRRAVPVLRPVPVDRVESEGELLVVRSGERAWHTRTLVNATGTWSHPFIPTVPGAADFRGEQFHTATFPGLEHLRGRRALVVGGGASAVQFLGMLAPVTDTLWVTRRPPVWMNGGEFDGLRAVTEVEERVVAGLAPRSVVSVTGLALRPQEQAAARTGIYERRLPMFSRIEAEGVRWDSGRFEAVDVILWATGFRPALRHLAPLHLRAPGGGIALRRIDGNVQGATTAVADHRVQLVGYGPSASTIGAGHAARQAALAVERVVARGR
ncbi:flavin-containing monooxygenase [Brachybacterium sp. AOP25-B2-12]|uniref:flavin-containing monooxygenase n=1 Tax=Brachybacterium sp. AOP25-B2-12 TaxID=3457710 RepID=UPI004034E3EB